MHNDANKLDEARHGSSLIQEYVIEKVGEKKEKTHGIFSSFFPVLFSMISISGHKWMKNVFIKCLREHVPLLFLHFPEPRSIGGDVEKASTNDKKTKSRSDRS